MLGNEDGVVECLRTLVPGAESDVRAQTGPQEEKLDMLEHGLIGANEELT